MNDPYSLVRRTNKFNYLVDKEVVPWFNNTNKEHFNFSKTGENNMTNRKIVTVTLIDDDKGLPVENSIVAVFEGVVTEDSDHVTIQQILMDEPVKEKIEAHNSKRAEIVDNTILEATGNVVKLRPVQLKNLRWDIK